MVSFATVHGVLQRMAMLPSDSLQPAFVIEACSGILVLINNFSGKFKKNIKIVCVKHVIFVSRC